MRSVLLIDDDELVRETQSEALIALGYDVRLAATAEDGVRLAAAEPSVILLDQRLEGPTGGDVGLDLIERLVVASPTSRVLVMTGYASRASVRAAFDAGVFDYLEKGKSFGWLLPHKVRMAADAAAQARSRRPEAIEQQLGEALESAMIEPNPQRKGLLLEQTLLLLFRTIPGLTDARHDVRSTGQQIDVVVFNESKDPWLAKCGSVFLVECKNWSSKVGTPDVRALRTKMGNYNDHCQVGIMIAMGGYSDEVKPDQLRWSRSPNSLVLLLDQSLLTGWVASSNRARWLGEMLKKALMELDP